MKITHSKMSWQRKRGMTKIHDTTFTSIWTPKTNQELLYCKVCGQVFPEYREPEDYSGCKLDFYLAMLGIIKPE
jgi:hypothetical protein